jgi:hypothetical protein
MGPGCVKTLRGKGTPICGVIIQCGIEIDGEFSAACNKYCSNLSMKIQNMPLSKSFKRFIECCYDF